MYKRKILGLLLVILSIDQPGWSCGGGGCAGLGGTSVKNTTHGQLKQRSSQSLQQGQNNYVVESRLIDQYTKLGAQLESKRQWSKAEQSFRYVMQVMSRRDGPGSYNSLPVLEHLATVSRAQNKVDQAISYQKTVCLLTEAKPAEDRQAVLESKLTLANLFIQKNDWVKAEDVLSDAVTLANAEPSQPLKHRDLTYHAYAKVLRELHKESEAVAIEAAANANNMQSQKSAESTQVTLTQIPNGISSPAITAGGTK